MREAVAALLFLLLSSLAESCYSQAAAWSGKTIGYVAEHGKPFLEQRPNFILLHIGMNDISANPGSSTESNDPYGAEFRLARLIDQMLEACPEAVILVAMLISTTD